jgi:hypothetical protein
MPYRCLEAPKSSRILTNLKCVCDWRPRAPEILERVTVHFDDLTKQKWGFFIKNFRVLFSRSYQDLSESVKISLVAVLVFVLYRKQSRLVYLELFHRVSFSAFQPYNSVTKDSWQSLFRHVSNHIEFYYMPHSMQCGYVVLLKKWTILITNSCATKLLTRSIVGYGRLNKKIARLQGNPSVFKLWQGQLS